MNTSTVIILFLLALYLLKSLFIGFRFSQGKRAESADDFYLANRSLNWFFLGFTLFATWISTFAYLGAPGFYYAKGVKWLFAHGSMTVISPLLLWFIGRKIWLAGRKSNCLTPGDLLHYFHQNKAVRVMSGIISLLALIPYSLIQLIGIGKVLDAATQGFVPFWVGVVLSGIVMSLYAYFGGIRAIIWTDIFQSILFMIVMVGSAFISPLKVHRKSFECSLV